MNKLFGFTIFLLLSSVCWAGGNRENRTQTDRQQPHPNLPQIIESNVPSVSTQPIPPPPPQYWIGDGGRDLKLAVLEHIGRGINENEQWLLSLIQSSITGDFNRYSAVTVIDRQNLERILDEQKQSLSGIYSDEDYIRIGHLTNTRYILAGAVIRTGNNYILELSITDVETGVRKVSYGPQPVSLLALENLSAVKEATINLLAQLGVQLTDRALDELRNQVNITQIQAETALARGIVAQRQGTEVAALSYFFQAAAFQPTLVEAVNRSSILAANISSGNIGEDARSDIQWRRDWIDRLTETEQFFNSYFDDFFKNTSIPFSLLYTSDIRQEGEIDYQNETVTLGGMQTILNVSQDWALSIEPAFKAMQTLMQTILDGLNSTGRKTIWGLEQWPQQSSINLQIFERQVRIFKIVTELLNSNYRIIGRQEFWVSATYEYPIPLPGGRTSRVDLLTSGVDFISFPNVNVNEITDSLTIRISSVNGIAAETVARDGILQIQATSQREFFQYSSKYENEYARRFFQIDNNGAIIFNGTNSHSAIIIPSYINNVRVTAVQTLRGVEGLNTLIIPDNIALNWREWLNHRLTTIVLGRNVPHTNFTFGPTFFNAVPRPRPWPAVMVLRDGRWRIISQ